MIDVPLETQIKRSCARDDNDEVQVRNIINKKVDREARLAAVSDVITNTEGLDFLDSEVAKLHHLYTPLAMAKNNHEV